MRILTPVDVPGLSADFQWTAENFWTVEMSAKDIKAIEGVSQDLANEFETVTPEMLAQAEERQAGKIQTAEEEATPSVTEKGEV